MRNISDASCRQDQYVHFMFNKVFSENLAICVDNMVKYGRARQATDGSIVQHRKDVIGMPDN
jgi:hypothetical protein